MPLFTSFSVQSCRRRWRKHHLWNYFGCFVGCHAPCILGIFYGSPSILGCQKPLRRGEKAACPRGHDDVFDREYFEMTITCTVCVPPMIFVVDPPVLGSDKVPNLYSFKKKHIGIPNPGFPKLHFVQRLDAEDASCSIGHLCGKPLAASARVAWHNPQGGRFGSVTWHFSFFSEGWLGCLLDTYVF